MHGCATPLAVRNFVKRGAPGFAQAWTAEAAVATWVGPSLLPEDSVSYFTVYVVFDLMYLPVASTPTTES
jgi:hypothetical protein